MKHDGRTSMDSKKLHKTGTTVETIKYFPFISRADEIKFTKGLDHTRLTHEFILKKTPPPICDECRIPFTITHSTFLSKILSRKVKQFWKSNFILGNIVKQKKNSIY